MKITLIYAVFLHNCLMQSFADLTRNETRFWLSDEQKNFTQAKEDCNARNGRLAEVNDQPLRRALYEFALEQNYKGWGMWIGGSDSNSEGYWVWDGSGTHVPYLGWQCGQPDDRRGNQDCMVIAIGYRGRFDDATCSKPFKYFCEFHGIPEMDECSSSPCANGGTCTAGDNSYTCVCSSGWQGLNCQEHGKQNYTISLYEEFVSFAAARDSCIEKGGSLVMIKDEEKQRAIENVLKNAVNTGYFVGGNRQEQDEWKWLDGHEFTYENWIRNGAESRDFDCMNIYASALNYEWSGSPCDTYNYYLCEFIIV